jgi:hypothetical protein
MSARLHPERISRCAAWEIHAALGAPDPAEEWLRTKQSQRRSLAGSRAHECRHEENSRSPEIDQVGHAERDRRPISQERGQGAMTFGNCASEIGRTNACGAMVRASTTLRPHDGWHAGASGPGGASRIDSCERRLRVGYWQSGLTISPLIWTRLPAARMCAHVAPREIGNKNYKSRRFGDRRERLKNGGNIAGKECSIIRTGCFKILSHANYVTRVRSGSQSLRLEKWLADLIKECRMSFGVSRACECLIRWSVAVGVDSA